VKKVMLLAILVLGCAGFAQENAYKSVSDFGKYINKNGDYLVLPEGVYPQDDFKDGASKRDGLYGYVNRSGEEIIEAQYEEAGWFFGDFARVVKDGLQLIINKQGEIVFSEELLPQYRGRHIYISTPSSGVVMVSLLYELPDLIYQYVDLKGNPIVEPFEGDILGFNSGIGFYMEGRQGEWVAIDNTGKTIDGFEPAELYFPAGEQLFVQKLDNQMRYIDSRGNSVIEDNYTFVTPFFEGYAAVSRNERVPNQNLMTFQYTNLLKEGGGSYQIIDKYGNPINDIYYLGSPKFFQGGVAEVKILAQDGKMGYTALIDLNENGRIFDITEKRRLFGRPIIDDTTTRYSP
jgi:hypothetical protein